MGTFQKTHGVVKTTGFTPQTDGKAVLPSLTHTQLLEHWKINLMLHKAVTPTCQHFWKRKVHVTLPKGKC